MANKYTIELVELREQPSLVIKSSVAKDGTSEQLAQSLDRVFQFIEQAGGAPSGEPFMRYLELGNGQVTIAAGMPLAEAIAGAGEIEAHTLPGGRALTTVYLGDHGGVGAAWDAVWERAESLGVDTRSGGWDVYTNDPAEVPAREVQTRLYLPLADGG
jgi:effector-binding domain-containing protein